MESNLVQNLVNLKSLPKTWIIKDFKEVVSDNSGGNKKLAKSNFLKKGDIAVVDQGKKLIAGYYNDASLAVKTQPPYVVFGDHTRAFKYVDFPFVMGADGTKVLQPKKGNCETKYLYYFFLSINVPNTGYNRHFKYLKELKIPLPPLDQQKKIAAILDAADAYRQKTKALITKYEELTQSLFLDMFGDPVRNPMGWDEKSFENIAMFDTNMTKDFERYGDLLHVGIGNIKKNTGKIYGCISAKEEGVISGKYLFNDKHIIYSKIRPNLNKVALPDFEGLCSADSYPLLPINGVSNRIYIAFLLRSNCFVDFILKHSTRTNMPKANRSQMKLFKGICPPIELQSQFAERIQAIEEQKAQAQGSLAQAKDLFNSLLQKAFKGELV